MSQNYYVLKQRRDRVGKMRGTDFECVRNGTVRHILLVYIIYPDAGRGK